MSEQVSAIQRAFMSPLERLQHEIELMHDDRARRGQRRLAERGEHLSVAAKPATPLYGLERLRRVSAELAELATPTARPRLRLIQGGDHAGGGRAA